MPFIYKEIPREACIATCEALARTDARWHIHALEPGCAFNPKPSHYCFVIEDTDRAETWCAFSQNSFVDTCKHVVQLLHGTTILDPQQRTANALEHALVQSVHEATRLGLHWHHHMMMPGCIISPDPESHVITLEREDRDDIQDLRSVNPLDEILREIELVYFSTHK